MELDEAAKAARFIDDEWVLISLNVIATRWGSGNWEGWIQMGRPECPQD